MNHQLRNLGRNLSAGLRLAVFRPVSILDFRIGIAEVLLLLAVSAILDFTGDWLRYGGDDHWSGG